MGSRGHWQCRRGRCDHAGFPGPACLVLTHTDARTDGGTTGTAFGLEVVVVEPWLLWQSPQVRRDVGPRSANRAAEALRAAQGVGGEGALS